MKNLIMPTEIWVMLIYDFENLRKPLRYWKKYWNCSRPEDVIYEAIGHCYHKLGNFAQARFQLSEKHLILTLKTVSCIIKWRLLI